MTAKSSFSNIGPEQQKKLDRLCDHFEARIGRDKRPKIEAYLAKIPQPYREILLRELLLLEIEYFRSSGGGPQYDDCRNRFASYKPVIDAVFNAEWKVTGSNTGHTHTINSASLRDSSPSTPKLIGRYRIEEPLGFGAFGTVYRAHDPQLDRKVALKVPHEIHLSNPQFVKRFLNESKASACLQHPHIVPVFDAGRDGKRYYIASGFIEGETLDAAIDKQALDFRKTARIVMQLADALAYAHKQGIVHRDVKPDNVMLDTSGEPHLMDFGLARLETSDEKLTQDGSLMGTPAYMSPEQARGDVDEISPASDQYSLGATLYEMLCGDVPFSGPPQIVIFNVTQT